VLAIIKTRQYQVAAICMNILLL